MKQPKEFIDRTVQGEGYIYMKEIVVIQYRLAKRASAQVNADLAEDMKKAYEKYIKRIQGSSTASRKQKFQEVRFLGDFIDSSGIAYIYMNSNQCPLVYILLHPLATASMNNDLIGEVKYIYGKYILQMVEKKAV